MARATRVGLLEDFTVEVEGDGTKWRVRAMDAAEAATVAANIEWMRARRDHRADRRMVFKVRAGKYVHQYRYRIGRDGLDHVGWSP